MLLACNALIRNRNCAPSVTVTTLHCVQMFWKVLSLPRHLVEGVHVTRPPARTCSKPSSRHIQRVGKVPDTSAPLVHRYVLWKEGNAPLPCSAAARPRRQGQATSIVFPAANCARVHSLAAATVAIPSHATTPCLAVGRNGGGPTLLGWQSRTRSNC